MTHEKHQFKLDNDADIDHTSFAGLLDKNLDLVIQTFDAGPGFPMEIDGGYEDESWTFVLVGDESMVFNCYRRWGQMRVSCRQNARHLVEDFKAWLFVAGVEKVLKKNLIDSSATY